MNRVILIGNLTKDPELRATNNGTAICTFTVAVNRRFKDKAGDNITDFFPVVAWRQLGELCGKYLAKGRKAAITGELQTRAYEAKDGSKRYVTEIVAEEVEFLTPRAGGNDPQADTWAKQGFADIEDEGLPF